MSVPDTEVRYRHVPLPTQQRRLRHLRSIAVRNISHKETAAKSEDLHKIETFFTLHKDAQSHAFYTSERIEGTLNPTWRGFHLEQIYENPLQRRLTTSQTCCVVRVWRGRKETVSLCIEWTVHLDGLVYLGSKAQRDGVHYPQNTILFEILEGVYSMPMSPPQWDPGKDKLQVELASVHKSYSTQTLLRIKTVLRAIKQTQASVQRVKNSIEGRLHHSLVLENKRSQLEFQILKNNLMHSDTEWRSRELSADREILDHLETENTSKEETLKEQFMLIHQERAKLHEKKKHYFEVREDLIKTGAAMVLRRKELIAELAFIYPIMEPSQNQYTVCGVRLPNSEDFAGQDDTMIAVALGYTCHLVEMISRFLDVPMRYPMEHLGSKSIIRDHIIDKLSDRERDFPLYSKGKAKFQFNYGVYLLNKNIAQLRYYCALATTDLRLTLPNLKSLLEFRLGVKFETANAPVLAGQHMAIPPNLGGPQKSSNPMFGYAVTGKLPGGESPMSIRSEQSQEGILLPEPTGSSPEAEEETDNSPKVEEASSMKTALKSEGQPNFLRDGAKNKIDSLLQTKSSQDESIVNDDENSSQSEGNTPLKSCNVQNSDPAVSKLDDAEPTKLHSNKASHRNNFVKAEMKNGPKSDKITERQSFCDNSHSRRNENPSASGIKSLNLTNAKSPARNKTHDWILANDDASDSSNDENAGASYNSSFKMWQNDHVEFQPNDSPDNDKRTPPTSVMPDIVHIKPPDVKEEDVPTSTFKTKAMSNPTSPIAAEPGSCDDLLAKAESERIDGNLPPASIKTASLTGTRPLRRERTDSDADAEESATFVIAGSTRTLHSKILSECS